MILQRFVLAGYVLLMTCQVKKFDSSPLHEEFIHLYTGRRGCNLVLMATWPIVGIGSPLAFESHQKVVNAFLTITGDSTTKSDEFCISF